MNSLGSIQYGFFVDLRCDEKACDSTVIFYGPSWPTCDAAAEKAGWLLDQSTGTCFCPVCRPTPTVYSDNDAATLLSGEPSTPAMN